MSGRLRVDEYARWRQWGQRRGQPSRDAW